MGGIEWNEVSSKARGGTELMGRQLEASLPKDLLDEFQIILSRPRTLDPTKLRILWCHDLPGDPESTAALADGGWRRFHRLVFTSNWQMQAYVGTYGIPWAKCIVMHNAIHPLQADFDRYTQVKQTPVKLVYTPTPHRGLNVLYPVFLKLVEEGLDVELHVFSSFALYDWPERDKQYEALFEVMRQNERIHYHGSVPNERIREVLPGMHIFAYPSTWQETSCLCLIEAMSAGLLCVHPNLGALYETAGNWTMMYQWHEDPNYHAGIFHGVLRQAVELVAGATPQVIGGLRNQKSYADMFYGWNLRINQWEPFLRSLLNEPRGLEPTEVFSYRIG